MPSPKEDWYGHLVAQSRTNDIYTLLHHYLEPAWEPNHDLDFVTVRRNQLPGALKEVPSKHVSKKLPQQAYCFPGNDYVLLHNYQLTEYLHHAKWASIVEDFEGREFIELRYDWTEEAKHYFNYPLPYYGNTSPQGPNQKRFAFNTSLPKAMKKQLSFSRMIFCKKERKKNRLWRMQ